MLVFAGVGVSGRSRRPFDIGDGVERRLQPRKSLVTRWDSEQFSVEKRVIFLNIRGKNPKKGERST